MSDVIFCLEQIGQVVNNELKESQVRDKMVKLSKDMSIEAEHMSLLKEIRKQISEMQSEMRSLKSELHQTRFVSRGEEGPALNSIQEVITVLCTW